MKIVGIVVVVVAVLIGAYVYQQRRIATQMGSGDTIASDSSVTTSLATPTADTTPAPAKRAAMPGAATVSTTPATTQADANTAAPPASDTMERNPPNGTVFAGTGHMQVYRQGDITWRINTDTGDACILFATDREWRKPRVYQHGCHAS